jgi:hypothetical protein
MAMTAAVVPLLMVEDSDDEPADVVPADVWEEYRTLKAWCLDHLTQRAIYVARALAALAFAETHICPALGRLGTQLQGQRVLHTIMKTEPGTRTPAATTSHTGLDVDDAPLRGEMLRHLQEAGCCLISVAQPLSKLVERSHIWVQKVNLLLSQANMTEVVVPEVPFHICEQNSEMQQDTTLPEATPALWLTTASPVAVSMTRANLAHALRLIDVYGSLLQASWMQACDVSDQIQYWQPVTLSQLVKPSTKALASSPEVLQTVQGLRLFHKWPILRDVVESKDLTAALSKTAALLRHVATVVATGASHGLCMVDKCQP